VVGDGKAVASRSRPSASSATRPEPGTAA
jgi:hypothetical protein